MKSLKLKTRSESGFTLTELIIVIVVIGIIAAVAIPLYIHQHKQSDKPAATSAHHKPEHKAESPVDRKPVDVKKTYAADVLFPSVAGGVFDEAGQPVSGAAISLDGQKVISGLDGRWIVDSVTPGGHAITIAAPAGYKVLVSPEPVYVTGTTDAPITVWDFEVTNK